MARFALLLVWLIQLACQDYPFEHLPLLRLGVAKRIQVVQNFRPTDILFVIDDSGTMGEERGKLIASLERFITPLASSGMDFQLGIVTTDVDCLVPDRCCPEDPNSNCPPDQQSSTSCCRLTGSLGLGRGCSDELQLSPPHTTCNGGRLRAPSGKRFFRKPSNDPNARSAWIGEVTQTITNLGLCGSSYESGLEAMIRAVQCGKARVQSNGLWDNELPELCTDQALARLNAGFIRQEADLVIVFLTDEDDCSFRQRSKYFRPSDPADPNDQANHLCEPEECYAHYACFPFSNALSCNLAPGCAWDAQRGNCQIDRSSNETTNWINGDPVAFFRCDGQPRVENPPYPESVTAYVDLLRQVKTNIKQIRVAGVLGGRVLSESDVSSLGFQAIGCAGGEAGVNSRCGCLNTYQDLSQVDAKLTCEVTKVIGGLATQTPFVAQSNTMSCFGSATIGSGCQAMPGSRYVQFLEEIRQARITAGVNPDTLADSICRTSYESTIEKVVNTLILTRCFDFDPPLAEGQNIILRQINAAGEVRELQDLAVVGSATAGFRIAANRKEICLEGGVSKQLGDTFEILLRDDGTLPN